MAAGTIAQNLATTDHVLPKPSAKLPLVVDMDRFLVRADLGAEAAISELESTIQRLHSTLRGVRTDLDVGRIAELARKGLDVSCLPLNRDLVDYIDASVETGREVHLITGASQEIADAVAARIGGFASATGSTPARTLTPAEKLAHVTNRFPTGFAYAGRVPELIAAATALVVAGSNRAAAREAARAGRTIEAELAVDTPSLKTWLKALRCHQWAKNGLVFAPLFLGHAYGNMGAVAACLAGFVLLSLLASGTYLINDILDLDADRKHPTKRNRPLARGDIPMRTALAVAAATTIGSLAGAVALSLPFAACLAGYLATTLAYSIYLKRLLLVDVFVLAVLFTCRIAMGIALANVAPSPWLLTFTMFFFLSLSLAKRHVEVVNAGKRGITDIPGRDYQAADLPLTVALGVGCNAVAMLVLFLYLMNDAMPAGFYSHPYWLWGAAFIVFLWSLRIWGLSHRGKLDADPVAFAIRDKTSIALGLVVACVFALSI